jgi:hypothetical protein
MRCILGCGETIRVSLLMFDNIMDHLINAI